MSIGRGFAIKNNYVPRASTIHHSYKETINYAGNWLLCHRKWALLGKLASQDRSIPVPSPKRRPFALDYRLIVLIAVTDHHNDCNSDCSECFSDVLAVTSDNARRRWSADSIGNVSWTLLVCCPADVAVRWFRYVYERKNNTFSTMVMSYRSIEHHADWSSLNYSCDAVELWSVTTKYLTCK